LASETEEPLVECCQLRKQSSYAAAQEKKCMQLASPAARNTKTGVSVRKEYEADRASYSAGHRGQLEHITFKKWVGRS